MRVRARPTDWHLEGANVPIVDRWPHWELPVAVPRCHSEGRQHWRSVFLPSWPWWWGTWGLQRGTCHASRKTLYGFSRSPPHPRKIGIYGTLRFWIPFPNWYTNVPISYRYIGILSSLITLIFGMCIWSTLRARTLSHRPPHGPTVPTARLCTPPNQRHDLDRAWPGFAWTRPFAPTPMILLHATGLSSASLVVWHRSSSSQG